MRASFSCLFFGACLFGTTVAAAKEAYDGDTPLYRCSGHDEFDSSGGHWLRSGEEGGPIWAAMHWMTGWPRDDSEDLRDVRDHAQVIPPRGVMLPVDGVRQATSEIYACWVLKPLTREDAAPTKIKDARQPIEASCPQSPEHLPTELPTLTDVGRVRIDARQGKMYFFGADLRLVPHAGSGYLGIRREFAVTVHKSDGTFRIVLPQGRILTGSCESFR